MPHGCVSKPHTAVSKGCGLLLKVVIDTYVWNIIFAVRNEISLYYKLLYFDTSWWWWWWWSYFGRNMSWLVIKQLAIFMLWWTIYVLLLSYIWYKSSLVRLLAFTETSGDPEERTLCSVTYVYLHMRNCIRRYRGPEQVGVCSLYFEGARFKSWSGHRLSGMQFSWIFSVPSRNFEIVPWFFHFVIHRSSKLRTPYGRRSRLVDE